MMCAFERSPDSELVRLDVISSRSSVPRGQRNQLVVFAQGPSVWPGSLRCWSAGRLIGNQTIGFFGLYPYHLDPAMMATTVSELADLVETKKLRIHLGPQLPLSQAAEAHRLIENRQTTGKAVLLPWAD
jgi:NADPH:quinone reductase-like Zn-dependent oxidoreductase